MLKKNPFLIFILVLALVVVGGFSYKVFGDRYLKKTSEMPAELNKNANSTSKFGKNSNSSAENTDSTVLDGTDNDNAAESQNSNENGATGDVSKIGPKDCENRCVDFKGGDLDYCREICGLNQKNSNASSGDCSDRSGLTKDYCLRDLGIEKRDFKFCDQIADAKVKKNCRDRITEDMLD